MDGGPRQFGFRLLLLCATLLRLLTAAAAPLSADEAYYRVWSHALAWGYFDHPPMVALWIRLGTAVAGDTALGVRLLGPVSALLGTLLLMRAAEDLAPGRNAGRVAGALLNATLVLNVGAVVMTPDTPLLFFWTAALACLARLVRTGQPGWWLGVGLAAGLALDSKYTAALLGAALVVWLVAVPQARRWWRSWQLWAGGALALALFTPVLAWNAAHGWVSLAKQGGRVADWQPARAPQFLAELVAGQVGLATPLVACVLVAGLVWAARGALRRQPVPALLACVSLLPACSFMVHALGGRVQANWLAVVYPGAALAAACSAARFWRQASWFGAACAAAIYAQAAGPVLALPRSLDFTLIRLAGWSDLAGEVFAARVAAGADIVVAEEYGLASELAFHLRTPVAAMEPGWRAAEAGQRWATTSLPRMALAGHRILLVRSTRESGGPDPATWSDIRDAGRAARGRFGVVAETYRFYTAILSSERRVPCAVLLPPAAPALLKPP